MESGVKGHLKMNSVQVILGRGASEGHKGRGQGQGWGPLRAMKEEAKAGSVRWAQTGDPLGD